MDLEATPAAGSQPLRHTDPRPVVLCGASLLGAACGNWLLYDELPGINWTLWMLLCVSGFVYWTRSGGGALGVERMVFLALACILSGGAAITDVPWLHPAVVLSAIVLASWTLMASQAPLVQQHLGKVVCAPLFAMLQIMAADQQFASEASSALGVRRNLTAVRGGLLAIPVVLVFFLLLSAADPTLDAWRSSFIATLSDWAFVPQAIFFVLLSVALLGAYQIALRRRPAAPSNVSDAAPCPGVLDGAERLIVLGAVAALFALFLLLQASYLFTNPGARVGSGVTFAEAAHRGFGELTATVVLTAALILVLDRLARRGGSEQLVKYCTLLLIAESIPMLLSANARIAHYEAAYGYTLPRLYVHVYIGLVGIGMVLLARQILARIELGRLLQQMVVTCMLALAVLCYWNHAAWIVAKNVERYAVTRKVDIDHLQWLATNLPDAVPRLVASLPALSDADAAQLRALLYQRWAYMQLGVSNQDASAAPRAARWYRWNLRRAQAHAALAKLAAGTSQ